MSEFGDYIANFIEAENRFNRPTSASALAKRMGIKHSMMSRFINGTSTSCNKSTLDKMCGGISDDQKIQAGLLASYLRDQRAGPAKHLVAVDVIGSKVQEAPTDCGLSLKNIPLGIRKDIAAILSKIHSAPLRRSLHDLAEIARLHIG